MNRSRQELVALGDDFLEELYSSPGGEYARWCVQCGMCAASCPSVTRVDHSPRKLISLLRAGKQYEVLTSNSMWFCLSCYLCSERCPKGVVIPELMHALERLAINYGLPTGKTATPVMYETFIEEVRSYGRIHELDLISRFYMRTNPYAGSKFLPVALRLSSRRRIPLRPKKIKGLKQLRTILEKARALEGGP